MIVLAIDPGSEKSAWLVYDCTGRVRAFGIHDNQVLAGAVGGIFWSPDHLAIETLHVRGMPTAQQEMETQLWAGRFIQAAGLPFTQMRRLDVKLNLCGSVRAKDGNIRAALIDRWGGKDKAIGKKKTPGPLYGISADCWSALALAVTWMDKHNSPAPVAS